MKPGIPGSKLGYPIFNTRILGLVSIGWMNEGEKKRMNECKMNHLYDLALHKAILFINKFSLLAWLLRMRREDLVLP